MFELIVCIIGIYLFCMFVAYVVAPVASIAAAIAVIGGTVFGAAVSVVMYVRAFLEYRDPYALTGFVFDRTSADVYVDRSKKKQEYAVRRSYFFGPGYYSVFHTIGAAWSYNFSFIGDVKEWVDDARDFIDEGWLHIALTLVLYLFFVCVALAIGVLGGAMTIICSALHLLIITAIMLIVYAVFTILWLTDRIYLALHSIRTLCPHCKHRATVPHFLCPGCGAVHTRLIPSPYGVFSRTCTCGEKLPTTFLNGRSRLEARCPHCGDSLAASDSRQFGLTLVGGSSSGKTVLLTAFYHQFIEGVRDAMKTHLEIPEIHEDVFDEMERLYQGRSRVQGTVLSDSSTTYSVLLSGGGLKTRTQFSVFDVAGEAFASPDMQGMVYTSEMAYNNGIIIVIDPLSSPQICAEAQSMGIRVPEDTLKVRAAQIINNFATHLHTLPGAPKVGEKIARPTAVIISKLDLPCVYSKLSHMKIGRAIRGSGAPAIEVQDEMCKDFLLAYGFADALTALEANFSNLHFFPISARGDIEDGEAFEPDDYVMQPFAWLIRATNEELADALDVPTIDEILLGAYN